MAYIWKPALFKAGSSLLQLLRPIPTLQIGDSWKSEIHEMPLKDGALSFGNSLQPVSITVNGSVNITDDECPMVTEQEMFEAYEELRDYIAGVDDLTPLELFIFHDAGSATYVKFKEVYPENMQLNLGDENFSSFSYTLTLRADDTTIYNTAEGV